MRCATCEKNLPESDFYRQSNGGYFKHCKGCVKLRALKYRKDNLEYVREYDRKRGQLPSRKEANRLRSGLYTHNRKKWVESNPEKRAAQVAVCNAVRDGRLRRPSACEECKSDGRIHGHHDDYTKPLDVRWLCHDCHGAVHRELNESKRKISFEVGA
jgi:hypothetical protein